jgi:hypothetical protein
MTCTDARPAPLRCPTLDESIGATVALLPSGRAWPVNDGGGLLARYRAWLAALAAVPSRDAWPAGYVQAGLLSVIGAARHFIESRVCALLQEFWCATQSETRAEWMNEYGLPDDCDPFPDLCTKAAARGGSRCDYFNSIIARLGWRAECFEASDFCGSRYGKGKFGARGSTFGGSRALGLVVKVHVGPPVVVPTVATRYRRNRYGAIRFGQRPSCDTIEHPSIQPVRCLMERIAPAHVQIQYVA